MYLPVHPSLPLSYCARRTLLYHSAVQYDVRKYRYDRVVGWAAPPILEATRTTGPLRTSGYSYLARPASATLKQQQQTPRKLIPASKPSETQSPSSSLSPSLSHPTWTQFLLPFSTLISRSCLPLAFPIRLGAARPASPRHRPSRLKQHRQPVR